MRVGHRMATVIGHHMKVILTEQLKYPHRSDNKIGNIVNAWDYGGISLGIGQNRTNHQYQLFRGDENETEWGCLIERHLHINYILGESIKAPGV